MYEWVNDVNRFFDDYGISDFIDLVKNGISLPKQHGRLIDADKLREEIFVVDSYSEEPVKQQISDAPTIIEAKGQEPKIVRCENYKHFRKLPYHANTLGKCIQHTGFCPKGDWYCADFESQESEE